MSMIMAKVPQSTLRVTEPGQGDPCRFQIDSNEHRLVVSIKRTQADPLSNTSDAGIPEHTPLNRNVSNRSERDEAESTLSKLVSLGKRKEPSPPLDDLLGDSSESSRADSPLPPRKVARISHAIKKVTSPTKLPHEAPIDTSSGIPGATASGIFTNPFEAFLTPAKLPSRRRPKNRDRLSAALPTPPPSKSASDDGLPTRPRRVAVSTKLSSDDIAPRRVASLMKDIAIPGPYQPNNTNTTPIPTTTPATSIAPQPSATAVIAAPRIQMFPKKPESSGSSKSKGGGMSNELKSLTQLNASMRSKRHVTNVVLPSSQPYSLPLVVGWDQRDVAARGLLDPYEFSRPSDPVDDSSSHRKEDMDEEERKYAEAKRRLEDAERVERLHMQALILARNRTEEARRALEEQDKVYSLRSRLIR